MLTPEQAEVIRHFGETGGLASDRVGEPELAYYRAMLAADDAYQRARPAADAWPGEDPARARHRAAVERAKAAYHARLAEIEEAYAAALEGAADGE